nr:hypothetical protein [Tanacetum cinerariifolium]
MMLYVDALIVTGFNVSRLKDEKARRQGRTFNWQTATNGKMEYYEDDSFTNLEIEYPAIVFDDISDTPLSCEPMVSPLDNNEIDVNISFEESDDKEYMVIFGKNSFSCKIISVDNLKTDYEDENDKVNMPSSLSPEPIFGYIDDLDFFKDFENKFPAIAYNDLKSKSDPLMNLLHAKGRKSESRLLGGHFIGRLTTHFGLVSDQVAPRLERQQAATVGTSGAAEDAPTADESAQTFPTPVGMSSPNHPTSDIEDAFSSNSPNYTPASANYSPASPGNTPFESLNNSYGLAPMASPTLLLFHDDPYMKVMHSYDTIMPPQVPIPPPIIMPPSPMLSPMFNP